MIYVLIIWGSLAGSPPVPVAHYQSSDACEAAGKQYVEAARRSSYAAGYTCLPAAK